MGVKLEIGLIWVERMANAILVAVPAIRKISSIMDPKPEVIIVSNYQNN